MKQQMITAKIVVAALVLTCGSLARAWDTTWVGVSGTTTTGSDGLDYGNWTSPANWDNGIGIDTTMNVFIGPVAQNDGRVMMNANADSFTVNDLWVGSGAQPKMLSLTITGGTLQHTDGYVTQKTSRIGEGGNGVITQTGGTFYMNMGEMRIGVNVNSRNGNGLYDISGGTLSTAGGFYPGGDIAINRNQAYTAAMAGGYGELRIGGSATVNLGAPLTAPAALVFGPGGGVAGSSVLSVSGPNATIDINSIQMVTLSPSLNTGLIKFSFDNRGVSTIHVTSFANLAQGVLEVDYTGTPPAYGATFDLMTADVIQNTNGTFVLNPTNAANWSMAMVGTGVLGDGLLDTLQVKYIGRPALTITNAGNQIIVSWPASATGWTLQTNDALATGTWGNYTGTVVNNSVTNSPANVNLFYRLTQ